jgi:hypothetical protein
MTEYTVTVQTSDHGPVTLPDPLWCTGKDHPDGIARQDVAHLGPQSTVTIDTPEGPIDLLTFGLAEVPFSTNGTERVPHATVALGSADTWAADAAALDELATRLVEAAGKARYLARRLAVEIRGAR